MNTRRRPTAAHLDAAPARPHRTPRTIALTPAAELHFAARPSPDARGAGAPDLEPSPVETTKPRPRPRPVPPLNAGALVLRPDVERAVDVAVAATLAEVLPFMRATLRRELAALFTLPTPDTDPTPNV